MLLRYYARKIINNIVIKVIKPIVFVQYSLPLVILAILLIYHFYIDGSIILGGEGDFFIDFARHSDVYGSTWFDIGYGWPNVIPNPVGINNSILVGLLNIFDNYKVVNFMLVFTIYASAYISFLILAAYLGLSRKESIVISMLYAIGPFSINYLQALNQWNVLSISIMPLLYYLVLRYSYSPFKLFISIGLVTRILSFSLYNPPTAVIVLSVILIAGLQNMISKGVVSSQNIVEYFKVIIMAYAGFLVFNLDWLAVLSYSIQNNYIDAIFTPEFASSWAGAVSSQNELLFRVFSQRQIIASNTILDSFYNHTLFVIFLYGFTGLLIIKCALNRNAVIKLFAFLIVLLIFLTKGMASPFGAVYLYLMENVPYFYIFKTPTEKFGILLNFLIIIALANVISEKKEFLLKTLTWIFAAFCIIPIVFMDGFAASSDDGNYRMSRRHVFSEDDSKVINYLTSNYHNMRVLSFPGGLNYQVMIDSKYGVYTGLDPILSNAHVSYIHPGLDTEIYKDIFSLDWLHRLQEKNISAVVYNTKEIPWFGKSIKIGINTLSRHFIKIGMKEIVIGNYYIWHVPNSGNRVSFESY